MKKWTHRVASDDPLFFRWFKAQCSGCRLNPLPTVLATLGEDGQFRMAERFPWAEKTYGHVISVVSSQERVSGEKPWLRMSGPPVCPCTGLDPEVHAAGIARLEAALKADIEARDSC